MKWKFDFFNKTLMKKLLPAMNEPDYIESSYRKDQKIANGWGADSFYTTGKSILAC